MEKDIKQLLINELRDILSCEKQIHEALPEFIAAAESPDLKEELSSHLKDANEQIQRLEKVFNFLKVPASEKLCLGAQGLIQECKEVWQDYPTPSPMRDAALISKMQRIEHYEISAYGTMRTFALEMGLDGVADLLQTSLEEEAAADKKLTKIAEGGIFKTGINQKACCNKNK